MRKKEKKIQAFLLITGIFLILLTYFYYPYMNRNKSVVEKKIQENLPNISSNTNEDITLFEDLEYQGLYDLDKKFIVKSKKAHINQDEPDIVIMKNMHVILYLKDGRVVNIFSDEGKYNKENYDCFFEKNVKATDESTIILAENLDLLANKNYIEVYNNVTLDHTAGYLEADKINYNLETKYFNVSMFDDKDVKMKVIK